MMRKHREPTPQELERIRGNEEIRTSEIVAGDVDFGSLQKTKELAPMILDDGMIEKYFSPFMSVPSQNGQEEIIVHNHLYSPAYEPLRLFCSRKFPLGNMTETEIAQFRSSLHGTVQEARTLTRSKEEQFIINSLEKYIFWTVVTHARNGNTIKAVTETRVYKQIMTPQVEKKKGWFGF